MKTEEQKQKDRIKRAASTLGKLSQLKHPKSREFLSEMGKKGMAVRWGKKAKKSQKKNP